MITILASICDALAHSSNFAEDYCNFKMNFFREHQWIERQGKKEWVVFSTRLGTDFFQETKRFLECGGKIKAEGTEKLGEYDLNYNLWLERVRR